MTSIPRAIRIDVKIVSFVRAFRLAYDRGPSLSEIMLEVGAGSKTTVSRAVGRLLAAGRLMRTDCGGLDVPGNSEAAIVHLRRLGFTIFAPGEKVERNSNYATPADLADLLGKLD